jgi:hypothetical protein
MTKSAARFLEEDGAPHLGAVKMKGAENQGVDRFQAMGQEEENSLEPKLLPTSGGQLTWDSGGTKSLDIRVEGKQIRNNVINSVMTLCNKNDATAFYWRGTSE